LQALRSSLLSLVKPVKKLTLKKTIAGNLDAMPEGAEVVVQQTPSSFAVPVTSTPSSTPLTTPEPTPAKEVRFFIIHKSIFCQV